MVGEETSCLLQKLGFQYEAFDLLGVALDLTRIVGQANALDQGSALQRLRSSLDLEVLDQRHGIAVLKLSPVAVLYNDVGHDVPAVIQSAAASFARLKRRAALS